MITISIVDMITISDPDGLLNLQFTCPTCGSIYFGTSNALSDDAKGYCKGNIILDEFHPKGYSGYSGCDFRWMRTNDKQYFKEKTKL